MIDIIKTLDIHEKAMDIHQKAIEKLVGTTDHMNKVINGLLEQGKCSIQRDIVQEMINSALDSRISELEDNDVSERLDHMEEYIDKLVKRVKELEANSSNTNTHNRTQHSSCTHCHCTHCHK